MATLFESLVAGIDRLRETHDPKDLEHLIVNYAVSRTHLLDPDELNVVRNEALFGIIKLIQQHTPSIRIAQQSPRIIRNKIVDVIRDRGPVTTSLDTMSLGQPNNFATDRDDLHRQFAGRDLVRRTLAALQTIEQEHPRYYAAIYARMYGYDVAQYLSERFGPTSRAAADTITHRARKKLLGLLGEEAS